VAKTAGFTLVELLPANAIFTVNHYDLYDSNGDNVVDTYSMRLIVNGISHRTPDWPLLSTPQGIFTCTPAGNPC